MSDYLRIGELSRTTGTKVETIRYYERIGLIDPPLRTLANYRAYAPAHLARLSFIRRARALGFSLEQVRQFLQLADDKDAPCDRIDEIAQQHRAAVEAKLADLMALRDELDAIIGQCRTGKVSDCTILEALSPQAQD